MTRPPSRRVRSIAPAVLVVCLLLSGLARAAPPPDCPSLPWASLRIVNGNYASASKFASFHVFLRSGARRCSGSLVSSEWVLFAAHCQLQAGDIALVASYDIDPGSAYRVKKVVRHPGFVANATGMYNDIGLAKLQRPVYKRQRVLLALAKDADKPLPGAIARVSGYGVARETGGAPGTLRYADLEVIKVKKCAEMIRTAGAPGIASGIGEEMHVCVNDELCGGGICAGDSGGPLTVRAKTGHVVQVGVTSYRLGKCGARGFPDVFTRVASYKDWIQQVTEYAATFEEIV